MDTGIRGELLAANLTVDEIREYLDVDSLSYLTLDRLLDSTGAAGAGFCSACITGDYPVEIPVNLSKQLLEPGGRLDQPEWAMPTPATDAGSALPTEEAARLFGRN
jgi:amidophosphoribosyltransferase